MYTVQQPLGLGAVGSGQLNIFHFVSKIWYSSYSISGYDDENIVQDSQN